MLANSLILGLITYTGSVIYNLMADRSLERVFFISFRFLFFVTLTTFLLQLSFYLIKNLNNSKEAEEAEEFEAENKNSESEAQKGEASKAESDNLNESAVENDFENFNSEDFSAFNSEEFDY